MQDHIALCIGFTPSDRFFNVIDAVKKYLADHKAPKSLKEESDGVVGIGRGSRVYLIGKALGQDIRIKELARQLSVHVNNQLWKDINFIIETRSDWSNIQHKPYCQKIF